MAIAHWPSRAELTVLGAVDLHQVWTGLERSMLSRFTSLPIWLVNILSHFIRIYLICIVLLGTKQCLLVPREHPCFPLHPLSYYLLRHLARPNRETFCSFTPSCRLWSVLLWVTPVTMLPSVSQSVTSTVVSAKTAAFIFLSYCLSLCSSVNTEWMDERAASNFRLRSLKGSHSVWMIEISLLCHYLIRMHYMQ